MRPRAFVIALVFALALADCSKSPEGPGELFPTATSVHAYLYEHPPAPGGFILSDDFGHRNATAVPAEGVVLSAAQIVRLKTALLHGRPQLSSAACPFDPHHGFVFADAKGLVVGTLDVCFECDDVQYWAPGLREGADEGARAAAGIPPRDEIVDYHALEKLVTELGLPIHPAASDFERLRQPKP